MASTDLRFWAMVRPAMGCWVWVGARYPNGYGHLQRHGRSLYAHRNRACVNPIHLEAVTQQENLRRGEHWQRRKTHCKHGHPFDAANTYVSPTTGFRTCIACRHRNARNFYARKGSAA
jgi:hypothetical protein